LLLKPRFAVELERSESSLKRELAREEEAHRKELERAEARGESAGTLAADRLAEVAQLSATVARLEEELARLTGTAESS